jgi:hypothetical protein
MVIRVTKLARRFHSTKAMKTLLRISITATLLLIAQSLLADENLRSVPIGSTWFADGCESWNCAAAAMVLANGDGSVVALPSQDAKFKWVVLRRIPAGAVYVTQENPFQVDVVPSYVQGASLLATMDIRQSPMILTVGQTILFIRTRVPRERAAQH